MAETIVAIASLVPTTVLFGWAGKLAHDGKAGWLWLIAAGLLCTPHIKVTYP